MTILFMEDWDRLPGAIVDHKTKNTDFVRLASLYREMGVKNNGMILALHNRELQGVDPFNPPDKEYAKAIAIECKDNFWYFIREVARDPAGSEDFPLPFIPNRGIIAAYWLYFNHILFILIMIRQTGKSFGIDWLITWLLNFGLTDSEIMQITRNETLRSRELGRLKDMELVLPPYLKQRSTKDPGNTELLRISSLNNTFRSVLPNPSEKMADSVGRGMTSANTFGDELAYLVNNFITINVMLSATQAAREVSRKKNEPYCTVFTTTSGKRNTPEGAFAYELMTSAMVWSEMLMNSKDNDQLREIIRNAAGGNERINATFNHRQLGKDDKWLATRLRESLLDNVNDPNARIQIEADYLNLWPAGSELTPFPQDVAMTISKSEVLDFYTEINKEMYSLRWYYPREDIERILNTDEHILAIDGSEAIGKDSIGIVLGNVRTGEVAMVTDIPRTNIIVFCRWLADLMERHLKILVIPERRSTGSTISDYLLLYLPVKGIDPFRRIFNLVVHDADVYPQRFKEIQGIANTKEDLYTKYKETFGFATSGSGRMSRSSLYTETLLAAGRNIGHVVKDRTLILQMLGLVIKSNRIDHRDGEHDDLVIAWLLFYWLMEKGKNLYYYGIDPSVIMSKNRVILEKKATVTAHMAYKQRRAKAQIEYLKKELSIEKDHFIIERLENELEEAARDLSEEDKQYFSADDFIQSIREKRRKVQPMLDVNLNPGENLYVRFDGARDLYSGMQVYRN